VERRSALPAGSDLRRLERKERRVSPQVLPRKQGARAEVRPFVTGK
jgi:hypothetical protein